MDVLLDTNIYYQDFQMAGAKFQGLFEYLSKTRTKIIMPDIIYQEVVKNFKEQLSIEYLKVKRASSIMGIGVDITKTEEEIYTAFIDKLKQMTRYSHSPIKIVKHQNIDIGGLIEKSVNQKKPFKDKGRGFKDAIIWESVKEYLEKNEDDLCFISDNHNDFGTKVLDCDLQKEIKSYQKKLKYYNKLDDFLVEYAEKVAFINDGYIEKFIESNEDAIESIFQDFYETDINIRDLIFLSDVSMPPEHVNINYVEINGINPTTYYIYRATKNHYYVEIELELDLTVWVDVIDYDGEEHNDISSYLTEYIYVQALVDRKTERAKLHSD
ncbi:MAG: PIN domain-containing protein [Patescibacteria group bacterium]